MKASIVKFTKNIFFVIFFVSFFVLSIHNSVFGAEVSKKTTVARAEIETKDGMTLIGDFYPSKIKDKKMPLVILLHSFGGKSSDWGDLPKKIVEEGNNVFALDLRGHGRSVYNRNFVYKSYKYFTEKTWLKLPDDVVEVIHFMKETYSKVDYTNITFVGADLGANTAVLAGSKLKDKPKKFILVSPAQEFKHLYIPIVISEYHNVPMMVMVSESDKYFLKQGNIISKFIQAPHVMKIYKEGGNGTLLLKRNPSSYDEIVNFIYNK